MRRNHAASSTHLPIFRRLTRLLELAGVAILIVTASLAGLVGRAAATGPSQGSQIPGSALCNAACTTTPFSSGQIIKVVVPANSVFSSGASIKIVECAQSVVSATSDLVALPLCDGLTANGDTVLTGADGSFTYTNQTMYALPDALNLGEGSAGMPKCDPADPCVLYIGTDFTHPFSSPHFFSQTFYVNPTAGDTGANPGDGSAPTLGGTSAANSTIAATPTTVAADGSNSSMVRVTMLSSDTTPLPETGKVVTLAQGAGGHSTITTVSGTTDASGQATFTVTDATAEAVTYTATDTTDSVVPSHTATVTFSAPVVTPAHSSVSASPAQVTADGMTSSTITVILRDQGTNPAGVAGKAVTLAQGGGHSTITAVSATTNASGQATFTATDTTNEVVTYTATDTTDTMPITGQSASVTFGTISVSGSASTVAAGNTLVSTLNTAGTAVTVTLLGSEGAP